LVESLDKKSADIQGQQDLEINIPTAAEEEKKPKKQNTNDKTQICLQPR
jgi:hypothetical protein